VNKKTVPLWNMIQAKVHFICW